MARKFQTLEEVIFHLQEKAKEKILSVKEIIQVLSGKGKPLIVLFLSLPFCQPIQIPGVSIPFGLFIAFIGIRMAFGKRMWLPKKILKKNVSQRKLLKITKGTLRLMKKIKHLLHPRLIWFCENTIMEIANGIVIALLGLFLAFPLPIPFSNLIAAWALFLITLGVLEHDGLFVLIGYLLAFVAFFFLIFMILTLKNVLSTLVY